MSDLNSMLKIRKKKGIIHPFALLVMVGIALGEEYTVRVLFNKIAQFFHFGTQGGSVLMYGVFGILYVIHLKDILNGLIQKKAYDALAVPLIALIGCIVYNLYQANSSYLLANDSLVKVFLFYIPIYLLIRSLKDYDIIENYLWIYAYIDLIFCMSVFNISRIDLQQGYDTHMTVGYQMTMIGMILCSTFLRSSKKKVTSWIHLTVSIFALVFVVAFGSRGSLIVILIYGFCLLFKHTNLKSIKIRHLLIFLVASLFLIFRTQLLMLAGDLFEKLGFNSRTLAWLLQADSTLDSSGRDLLYVDALEAIWNNPVTGYGLFGDRFLLSGRYIHNFFLEILVDYGVFLGGIICVVLISKLAKIIEVMKRFPVGGACIIYVMTQLMFSNSFLRLGVFWVALGYIFSMNIRRYEHVNKAND